ncbi:MAG: exodeoxyribonuclease III, partial [Dehalococcoidia bacterium]|nr:exodeoxyribonuclease III [Dehalococcoidia bacterium]
MAETIRAMSWNVNGIRAAHKKGFVEWLGQTNPDIMCLQETKAHLDQLPAALKEIEGYHSFFSTPEKKGYSGVGLYTKTEPEQVSFGLGVEEFDKEGRVLVADYGRFVLINIYFPNGQSSSERLQYKMEFYDHFLEFVEKIKASGKSIVLCGDLNTAHTEIDLARPEPNKGTSGFLPIEREWMDKFISHGYKDTFRMFNQEPENYT